MAGGSHESAIFLLLSRQRWEKVPEGRMRASLFAASKSPHPALRATFSREGRRTQKSRRAGSPGDGGLQLFLMRPHAGGDQLRSLPGVAPALDRD